MTNSQAETGDKANNLEPFKMCNIVTGVPCSFCAIISSDVHVFCIAPFVEYKGFQIVLFWCGIVFECRIWYLLLKRHKGKRKTWKQIYKWTDRHKTYTSGFMAILRRKCISLFREYQFFSKPKTKRIKRVKTYEDIIFTVRFCRNLLYNLHTNFQVWLAGTQKTNQKNQMCLMSP